MTTQRTPTTQAEMVRLVAWSTSFNEERVGQFERNTLPSLCHADGALVVLFSDGQWCQLKGGDVNDIGVLRFLCSKILSKGVQIHGLVPVPDVSDEQSSSSSSTQSPVKSFCINIGNGGGQSYRLDHVY